MTSGRNVLVAYARKDKRELVAQELRLCPIPGIIVHEAATLTGAIFVARTNDVDAAIVPIDLGEIDLGGLELIRTLSTTNAKCAFIITVEQVSPRVLRLANEFFPGQRIAFHCRSDSYGSLSTKLRNILFAPSDRYSKVAFESWVPTAHLSELEYSVLVCTSLGLSDPIAAQICGVGIKAIQARIRSLYSSLKVPAKQDDGLFPYNPRTRAIWLALRSGIINVDELSIRAEELKLQARQLEINVEI